MRPAKPFLPRIYYFDPRLAGDTDSDASEREMLLERCQGMGFDHVLVPPQREDSVQALAGACAARKLKLLLDVDIRSAAEDAALALSYPDWFEPVSQEDDLPDPRRPPGRQIVRHLRLDHAGVAEQVAGHWVQRLRTLCKAGAAGFRCIGLPDVPAALWGAIITGVRSAHATARFLAWTPGCTPAQIDALADCGFDATFSSGAWWDFRSRWLVDEQARLARVAPHIAFPDSPDEPVVGRITGNEEIAVRRRIFLRALGLAAATGNGMLITAGFEYGASGTSWNDMQARAPFDISNEIAQANGFIASVGPGFHGNPFRVISSPNAVVAMVLRVATPAANAPHSALLAVANADTARACAITESRLLEHAGGFIRHSRVWPGGNENNAPETAIALESADFQMFAVHKLPPVLIPPPRGKQAVSAAAKSPRIAIEAVSPAVDGGRFPAKRMVGESVSIEADVFTDGHDKLAVTALWRTADETEWHELRMHPLGNDRWAAALPLTRIGRYLFMIEAWRDVFATYRDELEKKTTAGLNVAVELEEGRLMVEAALAHAQESGIEEAAENLKAMAKSLKVTRDKANAANAAKAAARDAERIATLLSEPMLEAMRAADARPFAIRSEPAMRLDAERPAARFSSWYELFPRSQSGDPARHGSFADVEKRLPAIQAMGFDTLYFTPIHPIGKKHRKGRNNSLTAEPGDPGSPYAIGSEEGGHDAVHPRLGTLADFRHLRETAARHGLELALDFAIQCSPDHPWLKERPDWFSWRPDGTLRHAENPPKKYQDIVNVDFYAPGAVPDLWIALRDVVLFWVKEGVRVFRVDNPHTKTLPFWEWMIGDIRGRYPDTIFLSEAFTRPKMMYRLAKIGYSQSYTYFTWRHTKKEFIDYMTELTMTPVREYFRPHFFVNTPDINPYFLQRSGRPGFLIRAALATMLSGLWGMYSGFELCEGTPVPGKEEYLDSEKYEIKAWDWNRPGNIIQEITLLNRLRAENPALQTHLNIRFLHASNDNILFFVKATAPPDDGTRCGDNIVFVAINLDPFATHDTALEVPLWEFGLPDDGVLELDDLVGATHVSWHGKHQHLRLDPFVCPYAIWRVRHK